MKSNVCCKCGSTAIIPNVALLDYDASSSRPLSVSVPLPKPTGAFIFKGSESGHLRAWICGECGYTELYTSQFTALWDAHQKNQQA
jgi:predicted nucleic-acid-binding Zn-ribbon protein